MRYKVITLIMLIPLVLMVCVFSAANFTSLQVPISVNSVAVYHERLEVVNLAESNEFQINAQVMPINASNKGLIYTYESVNGKQMPTLDINENGLVKASGYGTAKVIVTTKDGAYKKSFLLEVTSTVATELVANLSKTEDIFVGDEFEILTTVLPDAALDKNVKFSSTDNHIVKVDALTGECKALSSGRVTLKATLENGINGKLEKSFDIVVLPNNSSNPITFNGSEQLTDNIFSEDFSVVMEINFTDLYSIGFTLNTNDIILNYDETQAESVELEYLSNNDGIYKYKLNINNMNVDEFNLSAKLNYENFANYTSQIKLKKIVDLTELDVKLTNFKNYIKMNSTNQFKVEISPSDFVGYEINAYFENNNITLVKSGEVYYYKGTIVGVNKLTVEVSFEGEVIKTITQDVEVLNPPSSLEFVANTESYGIEDLLTVGNEKIVLGEYVENKSTFDFVTNVNLENIEWSTSDEGIAKFVDGELIILNEGKVTIKATETQAKLLGIDLSCEILIRCVKGVEIGTYEDLVQATDDGKQVVLTNDIMLGKKLIHVYDDGSKEELYSKEESAKILASEVRQIETSAEWNYYKNYHNMTTPPTINYIIKFTNNVFGNGYSLNANNITNMVDGTNALYEYAVFRGPLNLVAIPEASVKAQDNICFIATDNVMLNNVELIGADMNGLDTTDLSSLNYVGTVLEVMGDNVKIVNSRIRNGRNCVRVYGKESGNYEKINVLIESCVISNAREFLVKMGTNKKLDGEFENAGSYNLADGNLPANVWEECAPKIENYRHLNDGTLTTEEYNALVEQYNNDTVFQDLIMTNLTIKNCVLHTSGLFSIGLESSFAGPALDGGRFNSWNFAEQGWVDIAGTSYPTMLNLEGDVRIYDWKKLSNIDTSILIDGDLLDFNLAQMIENVYNQGTFTEIITEVDGTKYAHGGIVMYGGGKNYALINNNLTNSSDLGNYTISLDSLNNSLTSVLKYASGKEDFRVLMYGKNSELNYYKQVADLQSGEAYNNLGKYVL